MEFVVTTDLITDILVRYRAPSRTCSVKATRSSSRASLGPWRIPIRRRRRGDREGRGIGRFFSATEVPAKHDEKYMPAEVAKAIDANKKKIAAAAARRGPDEERREESRELIALHCIGVLASNEEMEVREFYSLL
ncbi:hypothetical protein Scep_022781 [Stephania cephalantha]|uniref:Uncharacterized protein n=1 Tax=Stephania cephalantha TaxID=152367 RepID=A0AAP0F8P5_9MAGN